MWELARLIDGPEDLSRFDGADPRFLYRLGNALAATERYELAAKVYERIVGLQPDHVEVWLDPARYYLHVEEHDRVDDLLGEAVEAMPDSVDLYLFWGQALALQERYDEAIATFRSGLASGNQATSICSSAGATSTSSRSSTKRRSRSTGKVWQPEPAPCRCTYAGEWSSDARNAGSRRSIASTRLPVRRRTTRASPRPTSTPASPWRTSGACRRL